jgi:hypothetical protein
MHCIVQAGILTCLTANAVLQPLRRKGLLQDGMTSSVQNREGKGQLHPGTST